MKKYLYKLIVRIMSYFPLILVKKVNEVYNFGSTHTSIFEKYLETSSPSCLVFNSGERRPGCLTVGYELRCDIRLDRSDYMRLNIPDNSIDLIEVDLFLETIENDNYFWEFFREINRLIKINGKIKIKFLNLSVALDKKYLKEEFWNIKKRFLYSKNAAKFNSILSYLNNCKRIIDEETIENLLDLSGFKIDNFKNRSSLVEEMIVSKEVLTSDQWKLTNTLPEKGEIHNDSPIYLFNCDSELILKCLENVDSTKLINRNFVSVIGSLFFINIIPLIRPKEILLFDINPLQVRYMKLFIEIISISKNFKSFLEIFFSRKYKNNISDFLSQPKDPKLEKSTRNKVSDKEIFDLTLGKIANGKYKKLNGAVPVIEITNNSMCQNITIVDKEYFKPGPRINVINTSWGLAKNFSYIKSLLLDSKIIESKLEDKSVTEKLSTNSLLYVSNIGEEDWLNGIHAEYSEEEFRELTTKYNLDSSFKKQWKESVIGFNKFIANFKDNFWIIDSMGNIFATNSLLLERSDSHQWLWKKIKPKILGSNIEVIHKEAGKWGFKEYLKTINYKNYLISKNNYETVLLHILLANGVSLKFFRDILEKAVQTSKRIIIMEHDRDSLNFGELSEPSIIDVRSLLNIIRSVEIFKKAEIKVEWSGASRRIDKNLYDNKQNNNRNIIITIDL